MRTIFVYKDGSRCGVECCYNDKQILDTVVKLHFGNDLLYTFDEGLTERYLESHQHIHKYLNMGIQLQRPKFEFSRLQDFI